MLITIATVFILTSIPLFILIIIIIVIPEFSVYGQFYRMFASIGMISVGVKSFNGGVNVIIYYRMSNKFRQAML